MTSLLPAAVLWDMDGTVVDTEPYWMKAETDLVESHGGVWTHEDCMTLVGFGLWDAAAVLQGRGVALDADAIVAHLTGRVRQTIEEQGVPFRPGAQELLRELKDAGVKTALVTMSIRSMAEDIIGGIPFDAFDVIVPGDEVDQPKPHAAPYLRAAELLGVDPADCIAIEDSPTGLASAVAAGTIAIAVPHAIDIPPGPHHTTWATLEGRRLTDLAALVAGRQIQEDEAARR
ncbi:HAD family hydrolase [Plantibacter sp. YIM 135249]|uniref:HAD family hydrolase n=1 Tax=Plantibacter sp. YIM 135249 TaxID=3423918 RepID=UPI003D325CC3